MAKKKYFYTVWSGIQTGVFDEWDECKGFVIGVSHALHEKFSTREEAQEALEMGHKSYLKKKQKDNDFLNESLF